MSLRLVLFCAVAVVVAFARPPKWDELTLNYSFDDWRGDFGRTYPDPNEHQQRKSIFARRLLDIIRHNQDNSQSYKRGVNQFSDWTEEEFAAFNKLKPSIPKGPFPVDALEGEPLPRYIDYRRSQPPVLSGVKNQGHCGSCWAHSATESIESYFALLTGQLPVLSQQQITSCTESMFGCGGGSMTAGWEYVMKNATNGLYEEWAYPYVDFWCKNMTKAGTAKCRHISKEFLPHWTWVAKANVTGHQNIIPNDAHAARAALAKVGPLSIGVAAAGWQDYEAGIFMIPNATDKKYWSIDHGVQLVGYGHDQGRGKDYWIVRNSWGTNWGEDGFIKLDRPAKEPCYDYKHQNGQTQRICGTSAVLSGPDRPIVSELKKKNL